MSSHIFFIVNPYSKSGKAMKIWEAYILPKVLNLFPNANWAFTEQLLDAVFLAFHAKKNGYDIVVAVGGDGTINEVVNGLMDNILNSYQQNSPKIYGLSLNLSGKEHTTSLIPSLACLPVGTGCDFVKSLGIPNNIDFALEIIRAGKTIKCDVGVIQFKDKYFHSHLRYFINIAGCGANGEAVKRMNESKKMFGSKGSYFIATIQTLFRNRSFPVLISYDGEEYLPIDLRVLFVCNGQFCGSGMRVAKSASLQSGKFTVVQIKKMNPLKSIFLLNRIYSGDYSGLEGDILQKEVHSIQVLGEAKDPIPVECDGEQPGNLPASFSILPGALSVYSNLF